MSGASWADTPLKQRLAVLQRTRGLLAMRTGELVQAISPLLTRTAVDTLTAEVLPLLDAMKFLEREAATILAPRVLGRRGRPFWLSGVRSRIERVPFGHVVVLGPANFPLFLPAVHVLQALTAGNTVTWKPGRGGEAVAQAVASALSEARLPKAALRIMPDTTEAGEEALNLRPDKVIFTGSNAVGTRVLKSLAETATPAVAELSGEDAVFVLPTANLDRVAQTMGFGMRLNGGEVCMAPRRLIASPETWAALLPKLRAHAGGDLDRLSFVPATTLEESVAAHNQSLFGLTANIFYGPGDQNTADALTRALRVGVVLHNDIIAPTADPRLPFGGRGASGFGVTRGAEGLLEMTAVKVVIQRRGGRMRYLEPQRAGDADVLAALIRVVHGSGLRERWAALLQLNKTSRGKR